MNGDSQRDMLLYGIPGGTIVRGPLEVYGDLRIHGTLYCKSIVIINDDGEPITEKTNARINVLGIYPQNPLEDNPHTPNLKEKLPRRL